MNCIVQCVSEIEFTVDSLFLRGKTSLLNGISGAKYARHIKIVAAEKYGLEITLTGVLTVLIFFSKIGLLSGF